MKQLLMILSLLRYNLAPLVAPISPAIVIMVTFYNDLMGNSWNFFLAGIASLALAITIELGGMYVAKGFTDFWAKQDYTRMVISLVGLGAYAYFGISMTWGTILWPVFVFVTILYLVMACIDTQAEAVETKKDELNLGLLIAREEKLKANAEARTARFSSVTPENAPKKSVISEGYKQVKNYLDGVDNPEEVTPKMIIEQTGLGQTSVYKYKKRYLEQMVGDKNGNNK